MIRKCPYQDVVFENDNSGAYYAWLDKCPIDAYAKKYGLNYEKATEFNQWLEKCPTLVTKGEKYLAWEKEGENLEYPDEYEFAGSNLNLIPEELRTAKVLETANKVAEKEGLNVNFEAYGYKFQNAPQKTEKTFPCFYEMSFDAALKTAVKKTADQKSVREPVIENSRNKGGKAI